VAREGAEGAPDAAHEPAAVPLTELLARSAKSGDLTRFEELYARVAPSLYAWISLRLGPETRGRLDAEEVAQETWCRALELFPGFDAERVNFRAWLYAVAKNVVFECLRRMRRTDARPAGAEFASSLLAAHPDSATHITQRVARDDTIRRFLERVGAMEEGDRQLVLHCGLEGLSYDEAAERIGAKPGAVARRWQRLRAELQERAFAGDLLAP
jgi:RNA polymerase sigma-70 factor (ECF subfamily)